MQSNFTKNKAIEDRLNEQLMKQISKIVIVGIVSSIFFIAYFVVQLIMFSNAETAIKNNSQQLRAIFESMECSDSFLYQVRKL